MFYELEQGVYYTASRSFESTTGLGLTAASSPEPKVQQEMRRIASLTDFCEEQTRYSFLYSPELGFCMAAATACRSKDDKRLTPYVHMAFSRKHPDDAPAQYVFSIRFQTGGQELEGIIPRLKAEELPPWDSFTRKISVPQLAWLIQQLWAVLSAPNEGRPLLLSKDGLPPEWDESECLAQVIRQMADLVPPSLRENIRATTAPFSGKTKMFFKIFLNSEPSAVPLDRLPELVPDEDDYVGDLAIKMARSYLCNRAEFSTLIAQIEREALSNLQAGPQRMALAACCAATVPASAWAMQDQTLFAAYERVRDMLRNENADRPFWERQAENLRRITPPRELLDLLKWLREFEIPQDKQPMYLYNCYRRSPEQFYAQFPQIDRENRKVLTVLWSWEKSGVIMKALFPVNRESPEEFYRSLCSQLHFWTPLLHEDAYAGPAREFYSELLRGAPEAGLREMRPLFRTPKDLLEWEVQLAAVQRAVDRETRLPSLEMLEEIPKEWIAVSSVRDRLAELWREAEKDMKSREQYAGWKSAGKLLGVFDERAESEWVQQKIARVQTVRDAEDFASGTMQYLDKQQIQAFCEAALSPLITASSEPEDLERISAVLKKLPETSGTGQAERLLRQKMSTLRLCEQLRNGNLKELLRLTGDAEARKELDCCQDLRDLWMRRVESIIDAARREGNNPITEEDRDSILRSARWLEERQNRELAGRLCLFFFQSNVRELKDFLGVRRKGCRSYDSAMEQHIQELGKHTDFMGLYEFSASDSDFRAAAPASLWISLTMEERMDLLTDLASGKINGRYLENILCKSEPFCKLLFRLCSPAAPCVPFGEDEWPLFFDCTVQAAAELPGREKTLHSLLKVWRKSSSEITNEIVSALVRRIMEIAPSGKKSIRLALKIWKDVFHYTDYAPMFKTAWKDYKRQGLCGSLPPFPQAASLEEARREPETAPLEEAREEPAAPAAGGAEKHHSAVRCLEGCLAGMDQGMERMFICLSYVFRAPVKALIWLVRHF